MVPRHTYVHYYYVCSPGIIGETRSVSPRVDLQGFHKQRAPPSESDTHVDGLARDTGGRHGHLRGKCTKYAGRGGEGRDNSVRNRCRERER